MESKFKRQLGRRESAGRAEAMNFGRSSGFQRGRRARSAKVKLVGCRRGRASKPSAMDSSERAGWHLRARGRCLRPAGPAQWDWPAGLAARDEAGAPAGATISARASRRPTKRSTGDFARRPRMAAASARCPLGGPSAPAVWGQRKSVTFGTQRRRVRRWLQRRARSRDGGAAAAPLAARARA